MPRCVREALQILAANDYLKIKRSSGIYINLPEIPSDISSLKSAEDKLNLQDIQTLLETRILLETYAIKQTAMIITEEQLQQLYEIEDEAYHSMVDASKSGGKPLVIPASSWSTCWYRSSPTSTSRSFTAASARSGVNTDTNDFVTMPPAKRHRDHLAILRAVSENNPAKIERYVSMHLRDTYDSISLLINEIDSTKQ